MNLTDNQKKLLEHTLGSTDPEKWYRNYFCAGPSHSDLPDLEELEKNGIMRRIETPRFLMEKDIVFVVTDEGKDFLRVTP